MLQDLLENNVEGCPLGEGRRSLWTTFDIELHLVVANALYFLVYNERDTSPSDATRPRLDH